ncbi:MAG TPA: hypothetical protein PKL33_03870 [Accumulibacter sp.]|nr:hypothetical protein [Accumulibacter sp.]
MFGQMPWKRHGDSSLVGTVSVWNHIELIDTEYGMTHQVFTRHANASAEME